MLAREKPHCGVSGVPFMKRTTGAEATALSMADRVSDEMRRADGSWNAGRWNAVGKRWCCKKPGERAAGRNS